MATAWTAGHQCTVVECVSVCRFNVQKFRLRFMFQVKVHVCRCSGNGWSYHIEKSTLAKCLHGGFLPNFHHLFNHCFKLLHYIGCLWCWHVICTIRSIAVNQPHHYYQFCEKMFKKINSPIIELLMNFTYRPIQLEGLVTVCVFPQSC